MDEVSVSSSAVVESGEQLLLHFANQPQGLLTGLLASAYVVGVLSNKSDAPPSKDQLLDFVQLLLDWTALYWGEGPDKLVN